MDVVLAAILFGGLFFSFTTAANFRRVFIFILVLCLGILGMAYDPITSHLLNQGYTDLFRIFNELDVFRKYGWSIQPGYYDSTLFTTNYNPIIVAKLYMYVFATVTSNNHLLVLANVLLTNGAIAVGISLVGKRMQISNFVSTSIFVFFVIINDYSRVIANIRMPLAIALFILVWCVEVYKGKLEMWMFPAYFLICLLHNGMFIYLCIKILVTVIPKKIANFFIPVMLFSSMLVNPVIFLLTKFSGVGSIISGVLEKVNLYSTSQDVGMSAIIANKEMVIIDLIRILYFALLIYWANGIIQKKPRIKESLPVEKLLVFGKLLIAFSLGSLWSFNIFNRSVLFMLFVVPIVLLVISKSNKLHVLSIKRVNLFVFANWIMAIVSLIYYFGGHTYQQLNF
ncbi:hypothetical protein [Lactiplantibacillus songbeiensis]|uniref:EpsG family protein n=1 Tax=Lactiplantibacillus songbeiensis TaxID=2559920 RepID=A0ABW4C647_9LACO|nr:hypothetical protein [Lactiplantibacillus songbeiensis]